MAYTSSEFAQEIRKKHPGEFDDWPDDYLAQETVRVHPEYKDWVDLAPPESTLQKIGNLPTGLGPVRRGIEKAETAVTQALPRLTARLGAGPKLQTASEYASGIGTSLASGLGVPAAMMTIGGAAAGPPGAFAGLTASMLPEKVKEVPLAAAEAAALQYGIPKALAGLAARFPRQLPTFARMLGTGAKPVETARPEAPPPRTTQELFTPPTREAQIARTEANLPILNPGEGAIPPDVTPVPGVNIIPEAQLKATQELIQGAPEVPGPVFQGQATYNAIKEKGARTVLEETQSKFGPMFEKQRRGVISDVELKAMAETLGLTPEEVKGFIPGTIASPEKAVAAYNLTIGSARNMVNLAKDVAQGTASKEQFIESLSSHAALQANTDALFSEFGRGLRARQLGARDKFADIMLPQALLEKIKSDPQAVESMIKVLSEISPGDVPQANRILKSYGQKAGLFDKFLELTNANLLASDVPITNNVIGNTIASIWAIGVQHPATIATDAARAFFTGTPRQQFVREYGDGLFSMFRSFGPAARGMLDALKGNTPLERLKEMSGTATANTGILKPYIQGVFRAVFAPDVFAETISFHFQLGVEAARAAIKEGLTGTALTSRIEELTAKPTITMLEAAHKLSQFTTFKKPLGEFAKRIAQEQSKHKTGPLLKAVAFPFQGLDYLIDTFNNVRNHQYGKGVNLIFRFFRTPINLAGYSFKMAGLDPETYVKALTTGDPIQVNRALATVLTGAMVDSTIFMHALGGQITGDGPREPKSRANLELTGWRPRSLRVGNKYISYARAEPAASTIALVANVADAYKKGQLKEEPTTQVISEILAKTTNGFLDNPFAQGIKNILDFLQEPEKKGAAFAAGQVTPLIPSFAARVARYQDIRRIPKSIEERVKSRIPGLRQTLIPSRDALGDTIPEKSFIPAETRYSEVPTDPIRTGLQKYGLFVTIADNSFGRDKKTGNTLKLDPQEFDQYQQARGEKIKSKLSRLFSSSNFPDRKQASQQKEVDHAVTDAGAWARKKFKKLAE